MQSSLKQKITLCLRALTFILLCTANIAFALDLKTAKEQGLVGETENGYIAEVGSSNPEIETLINDINTQRKAVYQKIANENNISITAVEMRAGEKAFAKTPGGQWIKKAGTWEKK